MSDLAQDILEAIKEIQKEDARFKQNVHFILLSGIKVYPIPRFEEVPLDVFNAQSWEDWVRHAALHHSGNVFGELQKCTTMEVLINRYITWPRNQKYIFVPFLYHPEYHGYVVYKEFLKAA